MTELYIHHFREYRVRLGAKSLHTQKRKKPSRSTIQVLRRLLHPMDQFFDSRVLLIN